MKKVGPVTLAVLSLAWSVLAQEQPLKVKGGHELGETAEQFFAEGSEKMALSTCAARDFKSVDKSNRRLAKKICEDLVDARQQAISGKRSEYQSGGDPAEVRMDTFTFAGDHLEKVELLYSAPSAEVNYRGLSFETIFAGVKQAYGPPTRESTETTKSAYGVEYLAHSDLWLARDTAILITEKPGPGGSTTLIAFTRAEYDRTIEAGAPKPANPLE